MVTQHRWSAVLLSNGSKHHACRLCVSLGRQRLLSLCTGYPITCSRSLSAARAQQSCADISQLSPELQSQWDHKRIAYLTSSAVTSGSGHKVHWICTRCPDGYPHRWQATVVNQTNGRGCPSCSGQVVCPHNSLANQAPHLAKEWDTAKNVDLLGDYTFSSNQYAR